MAKVKKTKADEIVSALRSDAHRPITFRRLAEIKGCSDASIRSAIKYGRLPEPVYLEKTGEKTDPFFLWSQVKDFEVNPNRQG